MVRCLNTTGQHLAVNVGTLIGTFTGIDEQDIQVLKSSEDPEGEKTKSIRETEVPRVPGFIPRCLWELSR